MMKPDQGLTRRGALLAAGAVLGAGGKTSAQEASAKVYRIGVVSGTIHGKSQTRNGHTWNFAQYLHPAINLDAIKKYHYPGSEADFRWQRDPRNNFDVLPFPDTRITHYYDNDLAEAKRYAEAFPGVKPVAKV